MKTPPTIAARRPRQGRAGLMVGASLAVIVTAVASPPARAQSVAALMAASHQAMPAIPGLAAAPSSSASSASSIAMAAASARALRYQTQLNSAVDLAQQAQAAAQAAAAALNQNQLAGVIDGLGAGGLQPAVTKVTPASADATGVATWQGADLPTASGPNGADVSVVQTDPRAVLSWTTFNVGQHTTLTFQQQLNGAAQPSWVVLNRVVGVLDPTTGLPLANAAPAPSQILGSIKAGGTVLVLNENGILFGPTSQVNVGSLFATSLEVGRPFDVSQATFTDVRRDIAQRNTEFLDLGLLGYAGQNPTAPGYQFSAQVVAGGAVANSFQYDFPGSVTVKPGASLTAADGGALALLAPQVNDAGGLSASDGEVALQSGQFIAITASTGAAASADPDVRGLVVEGFLDPSAANPAADAVAIAQGGLIQSPRGYVSVGATSAGVVTDAGVITSTTSVAANGYVNLFGGTITVAPDAVIAIGPDPGTGTLPQDSASLSTFKSSRVRIGSYTANVLQPNGVQPPLATGPANIDIGADSLIYAPGGNISIGSDPSRPGTLSPTLGQVVVESGAVIDAAGLTDVLVPASRNEIKIDPVKGNELANAPAFRTGFLNGATVYLDPRLSGVTANGVAWIGSPLISAAAYAQQVGVSVSELMIKGGAVSIGVSAATSGGAPTFDVKPGAVIDISGGWKTYQAGPVQQSYLIDATGAVIPISQANPEATYIGLYQGYAVDQARWGVTQTYLDPLLTGPRQAGQYIEGQDGGSLTLTGPALGFDGSLYAGAFAGPQQMLNAVPGSATTVIPGDLRHLQAAPSQLPAGGYVDFNQATGGGGDIDIVGAGSYSPGGYDAQSATGDILNADALSGAGLSQLTVQTTGAIDLAADATIRLAPGGLFEASGGRTVTIDGSVIAPSGSIDIKTFGVDGLSFGSVLAPEPLQVGALDVVVNGVLSVAGLWTNDFKSTTGTLVGPAWQNGGEITLTGAPTVTLNGINTGGSSNTDVSGSVLIEAGARVDLSGGGYVGPTGAITATARGGNLSLIESSNFYQPLGDSSGFRVHGVVDGSQNPVTPNNPGALTSRVSIADGAILDAGFGGGGTFTLVAPAFDLIAAGGSSAVAPGQVGAVLPMDFFSKSGFASYSINSAGTDFLANSFSNGLGGFNAVLAVQIAEIKAGETLSLSQSYFSPVLSQAQTASLIGLASGSSLYSVLAPSVPADAWDQKAVSLSLGGLLELHVDKGGQVLGAPGSALAVNALLNEGLIRLPGGSITQADTILPTAGAAGVRSLSDVFGQPAADGTYLESRTTVFPFANGVDTRLTNGQVAASSTPSADRTPIYFLGDLSANQGVVLAAGSVTDLSGEVVVNPRAAPKGGISAQDFVDGTVFGGGSFTANGALNLATGVAGVVKSFLAEPGAVLDLDGAQALFDRPAPQGAPASGDVPTGYALTPIWTNGGSLTINQGGEVAGASISAQGGAPLALGGVLSVVNPVLYATDGAPPAFSAGQSITPLAAGDVTAAGFSTLIAQSSLSSVGDVALTLPRSLFLVSGVAANGQPATAPVIGAGGQLQIDAPYIGLYSRAQSAGTPAVGVLGTGSVTLAADAIDVTGAVVFDRSVGQIQLDATGDIRLIGALPNASQTQNTLVGQLAANGDITLTSAQVYPTTGTRFTLSTTGVSSPAESAGGSITFVAAGATPATPYAAGGALSVLAANIVQDGVVRTPLGQLTLGSSTKSVFAPATATLTLGSGSITSVSADGLNIPYGTTTDQVEWFFTPTQSAALTAPPAGELHLAGASITAASGASVDLKGGGDVYAYEFIAGVGGTRDVLSQFNPDPFSSTNGCQYPDCRQIYAIVPGLSNAPVAALDPIYSANYGALYGPAGAGTRVYLNAAPGLAASWYTLLPAQYAMLPGGMRVVQDTGAFTPPPVLGATLADGTIITSGYFGVSGVDARSSNLAVFDVQSQATVLTESKISLTSGDQYFAAKAAHNGLASPQLPIDAGQLILAPQTSLVLDAAFETAPGAGGRGATVDLSGASVIIDSAANPVIPPTGTIAVSDTSLADLDAASLFIGGVRTENADGTTSLNVVSQSITVAGGASLSAPEVILATTGSHAAITVENGASIVATGAVSGESTGDYVIEGLALDANGNPIPTNRVQGAQGGFLRVSNGPERLLTRLDVQSGPVGAITVGGVGLSAAPADLKGAAVEVNGLGQVAIAPDTTIDAEAVALAAGQISLGEGGGGLALTAQLRAELGKAQTLSLASQQAISVAAGTYDFNTLSLDTPGLAEAGAGAVRIDAAGALTLANSSPALHACGGTGGLACGADSLTLSAQTIAFGSGSVQAYGFGRSVTLDAVHGLFVDGAGGLDVGAAALTINSPFLGDRGTGLADAVQPSLTLTTTGAVSLASATPVSAFTAPAGTPGSSLTISGGSVAISGTELRATAGTLRIASGGGIAIRGGALLATPGDAKVFGDAADPTTVSAPGGLLSLTAQTGDVTISDDSRLSVGGSAGRAGTLSLNAAQGAVYAYHGVRSQTVSLISTIDATAPDGGASLSIDTGGSFDLSTFAQTGGKAFDGLIAIRSGHGDLTLAAGDTLTANGVSLTADGGEIADFGTIDTSGAKGGDVSLYAVAGVHLASTAIIDAHADGYGPNSTLQSKGGDVTLGVDFTGATTTDQTTGVVSGATSGAITVDKGAVIDVAAINTGDRLVHLSRNNGTYYTYVAGDLGGTVTLRAPVITAGGRQTVKVAFDGTIAGSSSTVLDAFERIRLDVLAADTSRFVGVTQSGDTITLDLAATGQGKINALADAGGPVVSFIQSFASTVSVPAGLAALANFHARPGLDLDYSGNITLASNWNLGAGQVDIAAAAAAGLLVPAPGLAGQYTVAGADGQTLLANEAKILADYTTATYRVGGSFYGEPGTLSLRAGGALTLNGSLTDGFFNFADQTDPNYLNQALGGGSLVYQASLGAPFCTLGCDSVPAFGAGSGGGNAVYIGFPGAIGFVNGAANNAGTAIALLSAPLDNAANSPSAEEPLGGALLSGWGDALGGAQLFPRLPGNAGGSVAAGSWSYQLVAGAALSARSSKGSVFAPSANPLAVVAGAPGDLTVQGQHVYGTQASPAGASYAPSLDLLGPGGGALAPDQWYQQFVAANSGLNADSLTTLDFSAASAPAGLSTLASQFFAANPDVPRDVLGAGVIDTTLAGAAKFMAFVSANFSQIAPGYTAPRQSVSPTEHWATAPTLVRTGSGDISLAAAGAIDLRNGDQSSDPALHGAPQILDSQGQLVDVKSQALSLGGAAVYTAGVSAELGAVIATDSATGIAYAVNLGANALPAADNLAGQTPVPSFQNPGILVANPVYAQGGGDVTLTAGTDVLSRRDSLQQYVLGGFVGGSSASPWIGTGDQAWRTGTIGSLVNLRINPQLFSEGIGTLGGGDIVVQASGSISDLSIVATSAVTTADVGAAGASGGQPMALVNLGGGDVSATAGGQVLGGRLDLAAGEATLTAEGGLVSAGQLQKLPGVSGALVDNALRVRLSDGQVQLVSGGPAELQSISALGVTPSASLSASANSSGFYGAGSGVAILADGPVTVANVGENPLPAQTAIYPGSFSAVSLTGSLDLAPASNSGGVLLYPDPTGALTLLADGDIAPAVIAQLDTDPTLLPGAFTTFAATAGLTGLPFAFPVVLPSTSDIALRALHNPAITHAGDTTPNRIDSGGDITDLTVSTAKMTRISAGQDIVNLVFLGQNVSATDISRIVAGRDIIASTALERLPFQPTAPLLATLQGNTFVLGGPGALFVEAGRDAGPFLNSAVTKTGQTFGGGVMTVGNLWNPWLPAAGADIFTEFGVGKGQNFAGLISAYLSPDSFASQPGYLFLQQTDAAGVSSPDPTKEIYSLSLLDWMKSIAGAVIQRYDTAAGVTTPPSTAPAVVRFLQGVQTGAAVTTAEALTYLPQLSGQLMPLIPWMQLHEPSVLTGAFGTLDVTYGQAFTAFQGLPALTQREFLIRNLYFNELIETSLPDSPSYLKYSRGYIAVNTLFPSAYGYTANSLSGGPGGASNPVYTGNLDLRLATLQTDQGGDISILGPGGEVLAGSVVSTSVQAARRNYAGVGLYSGLIQAAADSSVLPIAKIPAGYEGILTLQGGSIDAFTDVDFLLNQSRAFTEQGGDIALWSSNANVNAGQGPRTTPDVSPAVVHINEDAYSVVDTNATVSGAGIGAFAPDSTGLAPDIFLMAPRGTVDAGDAGVRTTGSVFIAAFQVANANAIQAQTVNGAGGPAAVNVSAQTSGDTAAAAASQAAQAAAAPSSQSERPVIYVDVLGYLPDETLTCTPEDLQKGKCK